VEPRVNVRQAWEPRLAQQRQALVLLVSEPIGQT
jgi:hypothetical protein